MRRKRIKGLALAVCLCILVSVLAVSALAVDMDAPVSLAVSATTSTDEAFIQDVAKAGVVVDLYQVGTVTPQENADGIELALIEPYTSKLALSKDMDYDAWLDLAQWAAEIALVLDESAAPVITGAAADGRSIEVPDMGLYLLIARGSGLDVDEYVTGVTDEAGNETLVTIARSENYEYSFLPEVIVLPAKADGNGDGVINTAAEDGEWLYDVEVALKPAREPLSTPTPPPTPTPTPTPTPGPKTTPTPGPKTTPTPKPSQTPRVTLTPTPTSGHPGRGVKTGDEMALRPFFIVMGISGVLFAALAIDSVRRRKRDREDRG